MKFLLISLSFFFLFFFFVCGGVYSQHMEVPRLGVELELHLLADATTTEMQDQTYMTPTPQLMAAPDP